MATRYLGASVVRIEDPRLLKGQGKYLDDLHLPGVKHVAFVRSTEAHARIIAIDVSAARAVEGVHAVLLASDLGPLAQKPMPIMAPSPFIRSGRTQLPLAADEVCYVGQPIAMIVAENRYVAEDAIALIDVQYESATAVVDCMQAREPGGPTVHFADDDNLAGTIHAKFGNPAHEFTAADLILRDRIVMHRGGCHSMEGRGVAVAQSADGSELTIWTSTQSPYLIRRFLAQYLEREESSLRVVAPDVGGGFGPKALFYPEEAALPLAALRFGWSLKWIEDRREHFVATTQQRDQVWDVEVAANNDGEIRAIRGRAVHDAGAFIPYGLLLPLSSLWPFPGPYKLAAIDLTMDVVYTNQITTSPVRGAGRPYAAFVIERCVDLVAAKTGLDRAEIRRRNFIKPSQFPYQTGMVYRDGSAVTYDSGDFEAGLDQALKLADYSGFADRRRLSEERGRRRGIGIASCIEDTGAGPFEGVTVRVLPSGKIQVVTSAASQGQGHATIMAQVCADRLGVDIGDISVISADTGAMAYGMGTYGSRIAVVASASTLQAADEVRKKALDLAAEQIDADPVDLEIVSGKIRIKGVPEPKLSLGDLARRLSGVPGIPLPVGFSAGLEATAYAPIDKVATSSGTHIAEVEVDSDTGEVHLVGYSVSHDCGRLLNPLLVDGQIMGGVVHGIGNALFERMIYDGQGQPLTTNYGEYLLPLATEIPRIKIGHIETLSPLSALGAKGAGEGGTIAAAPAIISAVEHALSRWNVRLSKHPISPPDLVEAIERAKEGTEFEFAGT
ncbi:MAG TPA: xanthine dehydrogenase family protein molybdopterin-binding subunit [Sphingomicrobium sp.]|nr:xanthine dehydrogenase family protein molybdopterin-binding subunit [Sphingomicrobium sp.]